MLKRILLVAVLIGGWGVAYAQDAVRPQIRIGTEWVMRRSGSVDGVTRTFHYAVAREERFQGRDYLVVARDDLEAWLAADTLSLGRVLRQGAEVDAYDPDWQDWRWPLFVGKTWSSDYRRRLEGRIEGPAHADWTVTAYEDVQVPAGTFKAFRIERKPGANTVYVATRWFAPSVGLMIKLIESQTDRRGEVVEELVSYRLPAEN